MFDLLLLTGVAGSFLVNLPGRWDGDELFVRSFLALVLILSFFVSPKRQIKSASVGVFLLTAMLSMLFNYHTPQRGVFMEVMLGFLAVNVIAERQTLTPAFLGKFLSIFWLCFNVVLLAQAMGSIYKGWELAGSFIMPWIMGSAACLSIPFVKSFGRRFCLFLLPAILLSHSSACVAVALLMYFYPIKLTYKKRYVIMAGGVVGLFLAYFLMFDFNFEITRFEVWRNTFAHIHNLIVGNGIGSWMHMAFSRMNGVTQIHWTTAHNLYYQVFFEMGILGLLALLAMLRGLWVKSYGPCRTALLGLLMLSLVHPVVHFPRFSVFLVVLMAMILRNDGVKCADCKP